MRFWIVLTVGALLSLPLLAANNATISEVTTGRYTTTPARLDEYLELSLRDPARLAATVSGDLLAFVPDAGKPGATWDFKRNYYSIVFAATRQEASDREIVRFLLHDGGNGVEVVDHLPGITGFFEVFLSEDPDASIATVFSTEPVANPLEVKALQAVKLIVEPLAGFIPAVLPAGPPGAPLPSDAAIIAALTAGAVTPPVYVVLRSVQLADPRSIVSVATSISDSTGFGRLDLINQLLRNSRALRQTVTLTSQCARTLASSIVTDAMNFLLHPATQPPSLIVPTAERKLIIASLKDDTANPAQGTIPRALNGAPCPLELASADAAPKAAAIATVQERLLSVLAAQSDPVTGSHKFSDTPLQHFDLGVAAGAIVNRSGAIRAKLEDGELIADSVSGLVSIAALHWHPVAFDPETARPTSAERASILFGFVVQPEPGLAAGVSWSLFRGLSVHASHTWMLVDQLKEDLDFGPKPADIDDPFRRGWTRAWIVGFGYNFE